MTNKLEALRKERGVRQEDLARALGVSRQTVISLEKGRYDPSLRLALRLGRYFGLPVEAIFDDAGARESERKDGPDRGEQDEEE